MVGRGSRALSRPPAKLNTTATTFRPSQVAMKGVYRAQQHHQ